MRTQGSKVGKPPDLYYIPVAQPSSLMDWLCKRFPVSLRNIWCVWTFQKGCVSTRARMNYSHSRE